MNEPLPQMDPIPMISPSQYICPNHDLPIQYICKKHSKYICKECLYEHSNHVHELISLIHSNQYKKPAFPSIQSTPSFPFGETVQSTLEH